MKNALLITNGFIKSEKFNEIYRFLEKACLNRQVFLFSMKNTEFMMFSHSEKQLKSEFERIINKKANKEINIDFIIFWDKDIYLAKAFERAGYKVYNNSFAIEYCDDKALTIEKLSKSEIKIPKTITAPKTFNNVGYDDGFINQFTLYCEEVLGYPYIIKERFGSFGMQVYLVKNALEAQDCIKKIGDVPFLAQEYIKFSHGRDIRINMVGEKAVASMLRTNEKGDFRANITIGGSMGAHECSMEEIKIAQTCMKELRLDFGGIDLLFGEDGFYLCEVNSNAHFKNIYDFTGVNVADKIIDYILKQEE